MLYGRPRGSNPELLSVYNPPLTSGAKMFVRRARATNYPLTVAYKGKRYTFRELNDKFGLKKAASIWRKYSSFGHGRKILELAGGIGRRHKEHVRSRRHKKAKTTPKKAKKTPKKPKRSSSKKSRKAKKSKSKSKHKKSKSKSKSRKAKKHKAKGGKPKVKRTKGGKKSKSRKSKKNPRRKRRNRK